MKKILVLLLSLLLCLTYCYSQSQQTYTVDSTTYIYGEYYKTTGKPKVQRSAKARQEFLKSKGYDKAPDGYHVDHIIPLSEGGADTPSNMQLIPIEQHKQKTSQERKNVANRTIYTGSSIQALGVVSITSMAREIRCTFQNNNKFLFKLLNIRIWLDFLNDLRSIKSYQKR